MFPRKIWPPIKPNTSRARGRLPPMTANLCSSWFRHITRVSRERPNEGVLFTLIAPIKVTNPLGRGETFSIGALPWPIPKYIYFIYERKREREFLSLSLFLSLCARASSGSVSLLHRARIIGKRLFSGLPATEIRFYVLNAGRLDMRNICDWRAICLRGGVARARARGSSEKEVGFNEYIAGFPSASSVHLSACDARKK